MVLQVYALHHRILVTRPANVLGDSADAEERAPERTSSNANAPSTQSEASAQGAAEHAVAAQLAALRHEIALRDEFISTAAHELRNPISPVYIQLEHLKEAIRGSSEPIARPWLLAQLETMTVRFDRFLETLNRLLDASRLGAGHIVLLPEFCDLVEVTRAVLASVQREIQASGSTVELDAPQIVTGWWDRLRLEQIIGNLVSNAVRYGAGRPISLEIIAELDEARLSVRDRGIGIAAEDLSRIFQRFERAGNVGRSAGFGIGLWVVAEVCRAMGGKIEVESELGRGAVFTLALPRKR
jgi:signal transduction histidine kinase